MPLYDYKCKSCSTVFIDQQFSIEDRLGPTKQTCSVCDEMTVILLMSPPNVVDSIRMGVTKPPSDVQRRLREIQKDHPNMKQGRHGQNITEV